MPINVNDFLFSPQVFLYSYFFVYICMLLFFLYCLLYLFTFLISNVFKPSCHLYCNIDYDM